MRSILLDILVCPSCKGQLLYYKANQELVCRYDHLAYPIRDEIPVLLKEEARLINHDELERINDH